MARLAARRQKPVEVEVEAEAEAEVSDDEELPELSTLLNGTGTGTGRNDAARVNTATMAASKRSSPRRRGPGAAGADGDREDVTATSKAHNGLGLHLNEKKKGLSAIRLAASVTMALPPSVASPVKRSPVKCSLAKVTEDVQLADERGSPGAAATSMQQRQRRLKLARVNPLLLPLGRGALGGGSAGEKEGADEKSDVEFDSSSTGVGAFKVDGEARPAGRAARTLSAMDETAFVPKFGAREEQNGRQRTTQRGSPRRAAKGKAAYLSRFVLKEARCNDDSSDSGCDADEAHTDLSGFIVDDEAELSFHGSDSGLDGESDSEMGKHSKKAPARQRGLQQGRNAARAKMEDEVDEVDNACDGREKFQVGDIAQDLFKLRLGVPGDDERRAEDIEVIDLTYSPPKARLDLQPKWRSATDNEIRPSPAKRSSAGTNPFASDGHNHLLKLSPPRFTSSANISHKGAEDNATITETLTTTPEHSSPDRSRQTHTYTTPPASPTKLKSPSKIHLLSPSKRGTAIPNSPHRQSIDAFWSSDVINTWNDQYSPHKPPLTVSPKKRGLARQLDFDIWSDSDKEDVNNSRNGTGNTSLSSDPPTPTRSSSPNKNPKSLSKLSSPSKKALAQAKLSFQATRHATAQSLLTHLDMHITSGKLSALSATTGGVQILWSKNLRSTAGRANWRRTVTKPPPGPPAAAKASRELAPLIQHYASIELAEKVIDSDARLVNTLAHEFCHLANFMVSGVRDQPHGASFKAWADNVTTHLRTAPNLPKLYRSAEVTTKHSYVINHKYLWVCAGQSALPGSAQAAARAFLALDDDPGCGAEYGRHSKSVDPEKHRCGKCKGLLVQVRPIPKVKSGKAELDGRSPKKGKGVSPAKRRGILTESKEGDDGGDNRTLDGLEKAMEYVNLSN